MNEQKLKEFFNRNHVKSFSPQTGILLLSIMESVLDQLKNVSDKELRKDLIKYCKALNTVTEVNEINVCGAIEMLDEQTRRNK